jgi:hypothetical protein
MPYLAEIFHFSKKIWHFANYFNYQTTALIVNELQNYHW